RWMADRGYGGYPMIITEFGVLLPDELGYDVVRVNAFMSATFEFLTATRDLALGDPSDDYRLVQRWAWFSLAVPPYDPATNQGFNGNLFDPATATITEHGSHYASYTGTWPPVDYVDLAIATWRILPSATVASPPQTVTVTVQIRVANLGTGVAGRLDTTAVAPEYSRSPELASPGAIGVEASQLLSYTVHLPLVSQGYEGYYSPPFSVLLSFDGPAGGTLIQSMPGLAPVSSEWLTFTLADLPPGRYNLTAWVDAGENVLESRECNNQDSTGLVVPTHRLYLPAMGNRSELLMLGIAASEIQGGAPAIAGQVDGVVPASIGPSPVYLGLSE
ncbi:MAG: hypothetical protein ACP5JJ_11305, partial [Anaerolineae bacterium]